MKTGKVRGRREAGIKMWRWGMQWKGEGGESDGGGKEQMETERERARRGHSVPSRAFI